MHVPVLPLQLLASLLPKKSDWCQDESTSRSSKWTDRISVNSEVPTLVFSGNFTKGGYKYFNTFFFFFF